MLIAACPEEQALTIGRCLRPRAEENRQRLAPRTSARKCRVPPEAGSTEGVATNESAVAARAVRRRCVPARPDDVGAGALSARTESCRGGTTRGGDPAATASGDATRTATAAAERQRRPAIVAPRLPRSPLRAARAALGSLRRPAALSAETGGRSTLVSSVRGPSIRTPGGRLDVWTMSGAEKRRRRGRGYPFANQSSVNTSPVESSGPGDASTVEPFAICSAVTSKLEIGLV